MVLLLAVAAAIVYMFNRGQLIPKKIRLTNTADAIAYSDGISSGFDPAPPSIGGGAILPQGRLAPPYRGAAADGKSAAITRAEMYFERPNGHNPLHNKHEQGSLFHSHWQVHLAAQLLRGRTSSVERE